MRYSMLVSLLVISVTCQAQTSTNNIMPSDISGAYTCSGVDPHKSKYENTALTITKSNQTYQFNWQNSIYGHFVGTGVAVSNSNTVAAFFMNTDKSKEMGVIVYTPDTNGNLQGIFTYKDLDKMGNETCTKSITQATH